MQHASIPSRLFAITLLAVFAMLAAGCAQATPTLSAPTAQQPADTPTAAPTHTATLAPTATEQPTSTPIQPTNTPEPTATAMPTLGVVAEDGLSAWCLLPGMLATQYKDPSAPPQNAVFGTVTEEGFDVSNLPYTACTFIYQFNQAAAPGMKLQIFEVEQTKPWLTADLLPVETDPNSAAAQVSHIYIVQPPLWDVSYDFAVVNADGTEIRRDRVNLHRWKPELCWNGQLPPMDTLRCPLMQDLHPWDPSYRTPFPTAVPEE